MLRYKKQKTINNSCNQRNQNIQFLRNKIFKTTFFSLFCSRQQDNHTNSPRGAAENLNLYWSEINDRIHKCQLDSQKNSCQINCNTHETIWWNNTTCYTNLTFCIRVTCGRRMLPPLNQFNTSRQPLHRFSRLIYLFLFRLCPYGFEWEIMCSSGMEWFGNHSLSFKIRVIALSEKQLRFIWRFYCFFMFLFSVIEFFDHSLVTFRHQKLLRFRQQNYFARCSLKFPLTALKLNL